MLFPRSVSRVDSSLPWSKEQAGSVAWPRSRNRHRPNRNSPGVGIYLGYKVIRAAVVSFFATPPCRSGLSGLARDLLGTMTIESLGHTLVEVEADICTRRAAPRRASTCSTQPPPSGAFGGPRELSRGRRRPWTALLLKSMMMRQYFEGLWSVTLRLGSRACSLQGYNRYFVSKGRTGIGQWS